jgi:hypothetical protein
MAGSYCGCSANWEALMKIAWSSITASFRSDGMMRKSAFGKPCPMASPPASKVTRFGGCGDSVTTIWQVPTKDGGYETIALSRSQAISRAGTAKVRPAPANGTADGSANTPVALIQPRNNRAQVGGSANEIRRSSVPPPRRRLRRHPPRFSTLRFSRRTETQPAKSAAATSGRRPNTKLRGTSKSCTWRSWADSRFV